ncbi:MAG: nucleotidyltransferase domain-containing protein [Prevotellaceae bacterium]|jgi:predicted nucleotidyltransferase|nr:nucleotidyltransferase domain-containing protein [Prevotellaceae bacterium]
MMNAIISKNIDKVRQICRQHHILSLFAFGSVLTEKFNDDSDIDLLVSFEPLEFGEYADNYFQAAESFEKIFNRRVDLVTDKSLHNPYFINSVNASKQLIYG